MREVKAQTLVSYLARPIGIEWAPYMRICIGRGEYSHSLLQMYAAHTNSIDRHTIRKCLNQAANAANTSHHITHTHTYIYLSHQLKVKCDVWSTRTAHRRLKNNFRANVGDALKRFHLYQLAVQAIVKYSFCLLLSISVCVRVCVFVTMTLPRFFLSSNEHI